MNCSRIVLLVCCLTLIPLPGFAQGLRDTACYGDVAEVNLRNQMSGEPKVPLRLPLATFPVVYGVDDRGQHVDPSTFCAPEPILADSVYFYPNHSPAANATLGFKAGEPTVRRFKLTYGRGLSRAYYDSLAANAREAMEQGKSTVTSHGFTKLYPTPSIAGEYLAQDYTEPNGQPFYLQCAPMVFGSECSAHYWLEGDVTVTYWFMTNNVSEAQWLDLDRAMRRIVTQLIDGDYLKSWEDTSGGIQ